MYTYHCHITKHVYIPLSQHKTCSYTTVTIQNMFMYHCHNTKHVHVPLSQYKTRTRTTVTIQNMFIYHCHNTKHVHIPLSQHKTCTLTTVTIQNMFMYHCDNTKHVHVTPGTPNINAFFQDIGLPGYFNVETSNLHLIVFLFKIIRRRRRVCIYIQTKNYYFGTQFIDFFQYI
jgi:hypothetical protein